MPGFPEGKHHDKETNGKVTGDEALRAPGRKYSEPIKDGDREADDECKDGPVWHQRRHPGEVSLAVDSLGAEGPVPAEEDNNHAGVCDNQAGGGEVDEPVEDSDGGVSTRQECDTGDEGDDGDAIDRNSGLGASDEEARGLPVLRERVQRAAGDVDEGVAAGPTGQHDKRIDKIGQAVNAQVLYADNPGGGCGASGALLDGADEPRIMGVADCADSQSADDVEADDTPKRHFHHAWDSVSGVLDLPGSKGGHIRPREGERGVDHHVEQPEEAAGVAGPVVFVHDTVGPVAEAVDVMLRVAADHGDECEEDEAEQEEHFCRGHDELALAVPFHCDDVQDDTDDHDYGDPDSRIDVCVPVLDHSSDG